MDELQEKRIFLQKGDILGKNIETFVLILIMNQKLGLVRFGRTLGSEFGRTELKRTELFGQTVRQKFGRTERSVHHYLHLQHYFLFLKIS